MDRRIRIVVIDDHPLMLAGIVATFENHDTMLEVVGSGCSAVEARLLAAQKQPDVVLMDINTLGESLEATSHICSINPDTKVIVFTFSERAENVVAAFDAGAKGYISKAIGSDELVRAVKSVSKGNIYVSPELAGKIFAPSSKNAALHFAAEDRLRTLSVREVKILELLNGGRSNKDIAGQLAIAEKTVKYYLTTIFGKLAVKNRLEAVIFFRDTSRNIDPTIRL
jgi:two-component system, NarL family, nitrate/nitrite response regulator NarL